MTWSNGRLSLFHGTNSHVFGTTPVLITTIAFNVDLARCRPNTDFGQGFYTTTSPHQATGWANVGTNYWRMRRRVPDARAIVLRFEVDRDQLADLDVLTFVRDTSDFYDFVAYCRAGEKPHGRLSGQGCYDVVFGPVTVGLQKQVIQNSDQISFHTEQATSCLCRIPAAIHDIGDAANGLLP